MLRAMRHAMVSLMNLDQERGKVAISRGWGDRDHRSNDACATLVYMTARAVLRLSRQHYQR